jgi:hypothetical protein
MALPWLLLLLVGLGAAWLRYGLIESSAIGQQCSAGGAPWWCLWRQTLVLGFLRNVYGIAALVVTALALVWPRTWLAWLAAALGVFALELYGFQSGALAMLIGCLRLLRTQAHLHATPIDQHRQRQREIQTEP